jgi:hypothetical protein
MIFEPAHAGRRDEQRRRAVAVGGHGAAEPPHEPPVDPEAAG